jgi:hypothetical protein
VVLLARYPLSTAIVLAALATVASVLLFARPQYRPPNQGSEVKIELSKYPPASHGWVWHGGQPGFRFGEDKETWNISEVKPSELAPARAAAHRWGVAPRSVRLIAAIRLGPHDLSMIVAGTNAADKTCLGFVVPSDTPRFYCGARLDPDSAFVLVTTRSSYPSGEGTVHPTFLTGIARGDVTRVVIDQRPDWRNVGIFGRKQGSLWGTFELSLRDSRAIHLAVFRKNGGITRMPVDVTKPGDLLIKIPG